MERKKISTVEHQGQNKSVCNKITHIILNILLSITVLLVAIAVISTLFSDKGDAFLLGYKPYILTSESMEPAYMKHSAVLIKKGGYDSVKPGDIIAFKAEKMGGKPAFHRVIEITDSGYVTKGDNCRTNDEQLVDGKSFIGREIWHTNITARIIPIAQTTDGLFMMFVMPVLLIITITVFVKILKKYGIHKRGTSNET